MVCPSCGCQNIRVTDSLPDNDGYVFRRRKCNGCGKSFRTAELIITEDDPLKYIFSEVDRTCHERRRVGGKR